jgi:predicted nucleic acid-binding protein
LSIYLDASVLVAMLTPDAMTSRAIALMRGKGLAAVVSDFAVAEVVSAVARQVRTKDTTPEDARAVFFQLDFWVATYAASTETTNADVRSADALMRRLDLPLRTPDALHIAIAERVGATLATFDVKMAAAARVIGLPVAAA